MDKLDYQPNEAARTLSKKQSSIIVVIVPQIGHPYFSEFLEELEKLAQKKDYKITYQNNKAVGIGTVIVTGKGKYSGFLGVEDFTIKFKKPTISKVKAGKGQMKVKWKRDKQAAGYEIQYSTNKNFSTDVQTITVDNRKEITLSGLLSKKKYYVRIKAFRYVKGQKWESDWSKKKKCKVK